MVTNTKHSDPRQHTKKMPAETDQHDSKLEKMARAIDPPSHEVTDDELKDPGRMTPDVPPVDNRS